jgi:D-alanyl-lipoteichoic acid acyltransferase DltB (MBOAT superfamily)
MSFDSPQFLIFFLVAVAVHLAWPPRSRWIWLLAASYYFYAAWAPEYVILLAVSTLLAYVLAIQIGKASTQPRRKALLALGLVLELGLLALFKYLGFFLDALGALFDRVSLSQDVPAVQLLLPIGISFYTFQTVGYLVDVYRRRVEPERHLGMLALFVSFFPQLIAGPIERAGHLLPQFRVRHSLSVSALTAGLRLMLWGMFKKVVIADRLAIYVDAVYDSPADYRGLPIVLATCFFAAQIYCDFSGYSDLVLGAARVMGYDLIDNFRQPYTSSSIAEFWRRWHISLSSWFRDYLYIPLGGNRVPWWRWYANLMIVFLLSGLWHGANWTFVLWGGLFGLLYVLEIWTQEARDRLARLLHLNKPALRTGIATLVTLSLVCFAWLFFRANSISDAFLLLANGAQIRASTDVQAPWAEAVANPGLETGFSLALVALVMGWQLFYRYEPPPFPAVGQRAWVRWLVYLLLALAILNLGIGKEVPFVYLQF